MRLGVARDIVFLEAVEINPVVVHGGGKAITRAMEAAGLKANFIQGMRLTDEATVGVVDQVLSREINPEIVKAISALGGEARGFSGADIFKCRKLLLDDKDHPGQKLDVGYVGEVIEVNTDPLLQCIQRGVTPVISPVALGEDGKIYNCNADVAAAQVAIALKARRLVFMSDVPGLMRDPKDPATLIRHLQTTEVPGLKAAGIVDKGMIPEGGQCRGRDQLRRGESFARGRAPAARSTDRDFHRRRRGYRSRPVVKVRPLAPAGEQRGRPAME